MSEVMTISRAHSSLNVSIHPLARDAFEWVHAYPKLISWKSLPSNLPYQLLQQPLQGVMQFQQGKSNGKNRPSSFQLYAPLWPALYWEDNRPPAGTLLIHNKSSNLPSNEDIERQAWTSALSLLFMSVDSGELATLREHFQSLLPRGIALNVFGKAQITDMDICKWTGCNRSTLVQQRRRAKKSSTQTEIAIKDPIALLSADWSPANGK